MRKPISCSALSKISPDSRTRSTVDGVVVAVVVVIVVVIVVTVVVDDVHLF